jgi:hypothetical protein
VEVFKSWYESRYVEGGLPEVALELLVGVIGWWARGDLNPGLDPILEHVVPPAIVFTVVYVT